MRESLAVAHKSGALKAKDLKRITVDTTVQPKAIAFPTDARLYDKGRRLLVRLAKRHGVALRQSYVIPSGVDNAPCRPMSCLRSHEQFLRGGNVVKCARLANSRSPGTW